LIKLHTHVSDRADVNQEKKKPRAPFPLYLEGGNIFFMVIKGERREDIRI